QQAPGRGIRAARTVLAPMPSRKPVRNAWLIPQTRSTAWAAKGWNGQLPSRTRVALQRIGSEWLIAVGVVGAVLAACAGFLDLMTLTLETRAFRTAVLHMSLVLTATIGYVAG